MDWLIEVLIGSSFAHMMAVLAFVIAVGMWLGRFKICGVSLGATFVLLVGIAVSHFGMKYQDKLYEEFKVEIPVAAQAETAAAPAENAEVAATEAPAENAETAADAATEMVAENAEATAEAKEEAKAKTLTVRFDRTSKAKDRQAYVEAYHGEAAPKSVKHFFDPDVLYFVQEFGLILFVYAVGLAAGPNFFSAFAKGGLKLNFLAVCIVFGGVATAAVIHLVTGINIGTVVGILSGAVTNTPGLGAATTVYGELGGDGSLLATAYATAYPLGVIGIIFSIIAVRVIFGVNIDKENEKLRAEQAAAKSEAKTDGAKKEAGHHPPVIEVFVGICLGMILGSFPIYVPGLSVPLKLGLAGGPLVVAILMGAFGEKIHFPTRISPSANALMREFGICMFLACVGLKAGETFVDSIMNGGLVWVGLGVIITVLPLMIVGPLAYKVFKVDYFTLMGVMSGSMTDPPALAYSSNAVGNDRPSIGYSTVYPLTMFLRIMTAQLLIIFFAA
ncbi:MAG: hypothetical protein IJ991_17305 [Thermoguttaceae bacterium]|nr:hypothetical protein [Thermoguttaceae bacterium]